MLFRRIYFLLLFLPLFGCGGGSASQSSSTSTTPAVQPRYYLGGGYPFPYDYSTFSANTSASLVSATAHVAYIQLHWQELANPGGLSLVDALKGPVASARQQGLKVYIAFDPLSLDRSQLQLPSGLAGDFTSSAVQQAYLSVVSQVASTYQPDYFVLMVEANLYSVNSASYAAYQQLYPQAYAAVKQASANTKTAVSLAYLDVNNQNCLDSSDRAVLASELAAFPKQDLFAISVYPLCYMDPKNIPDTFFSDVGALSTQPLFISETGWPSQLPGAAANEALQASYFTNLQRAANYAKSNGQSVDTINYVAMIDVSAQACNLLTQSYPQYGYWCTLGIRNPDGTAKMSYSTMKTWKQALDAGN